MNEMIFKDEAEHARYVEAINFLIELLNRERMTTIGTYVDLIYPDGKTKKVLCEFTARI